MSVATNIVLLDIKAERARQDRKFGDQTGHSDLFWNVVLGEEVGEVATALVENDLDNLRDELIQVAAVAVAWAENL